MSATAPASQRWLFGPLPDLLLGCGLLYAALFAVLVPASGWFQRVTPTFLAPLLVLLLSAPHYGATLLRVYEQRSERRRYALFSVWATLAIAALFVAGQHDAWVGSAVLTVYLIWSPWHYTGQNFGIAAMLLRRRGVALDGPARRWLHLSFTLSFVLAFAVMHESVGWAASRGLPLDGDRIRFLSLGTPGLLTTLAAVCYAAVLLVALVLLVRRAALRDLAPGLLLLASQALWFSAPAAARHWQLGGDVGPLAPDLQAGFFVWIAVAHAIQYLWVTAYYARASGSWHGTLPYLGKTFLAGAAIWTLPVAVFAPGVLGGVGYEAGLALLVAAAVNIHHFVLDGAIWKLRDGPIARVLIRSNVAPPDGHDAKRGSWLRRVSWALAAACGAVAAFVFVAEHFLVPGAMRAGDRPRAEALLDVLAVVGRDDSRSRGHLGFLAVQAGDVPAAERNIERSAELLPSMQGYGALIEVLVSDGRPEEALPWAERLLAIAPDELQALGLVAGLYAQTDRLEQARGLLERARELEARPIQPLPAPDTRSMVY